MKNLNKFIVLLFLLLAPLTATSAELLGASTNPESEQEQAQRQTFTNVIKRINTKRVRDKEAKVLEREIAALANYPLYPYLEYELIKHQIAKRPLVQITAFIKRYSNLPFTTSLRRIAINAKYKARQWQDVIALHKVGNNLNYQCMYLRALTKTGQQSLAFKTINTLWLTGQSLPSLCDPVLASWEKAGHKTAKLIEQRIELAFKQRNGKLAKYLAKSLTKPARKTFDYWYTLYRSPKKLTQSSYWKKRGHTANTMMFIALERLSYQEPVIAATLLEKIQHHQGFTTTQRKKLINKLALRLLTKDHIDDALDNWLKRFDWPLLTKSQQSQVLRHLIGLSEWQRIDAIFSQHFDHTSAPLAWQYWHSIALLELGQTQQATANLTKIAKKRRYYGFLASDKLKRPYSLNHRTLPIDQPQIATLLSKPHLKRAYQLYQLGRNVDAQREWYYLVRELTEQQRIGAAQIAHSWDWHDRTIITLTMTQWRDDLGLRFPTPHLDSFKKEAKRNELDLSWPLAIARQESAFMAKANSAVGARGLMQLMPGTAKLQARQSHVLYHRKAQLYKPEMNIRLGTGYLENMLKQFDNNLAVAAAAYNAGPHRVKHWVKKNLPQAQWVETIPYRETREYVKNVLAYSVIYQQRLSSQASLPSMAIAPERMEINAK